MMSRPTRESGRQFQLGRQGYLPFPGTRSAPQGSGEEYDSRHKNIMGRLDGMIGVLGRHPGRDLRAEMDSLLDAMLELFCPENSYLELVAFPRAAEHSQRHRVLCSLTARLCYQVGKGGALKTGELEYLRLLWLEHIELHDRAFAEFLVS